LNILVVNKLNANIMSNRAVQKINNVKIAQNLSFRIKLGGKEILLLTLQTGEKERERDGD
jgi:hypothetical protein